MHRRWVATAPTGTEALRLEDHEVPAPGPGEVTIEVRAAGANPADTRHFTRAAPEAFPVPIGYEVAGVVTAVGPDAGWTVGQEVLAFRITGGWASAVTVPAAAVFAKPETVPFEAAANLLLVGTTASEMLHVTGVTAGETILVHAVSGAVGVSVLQQAALVGARVVGTCGRRRFDVVRRFGGIPVEYGDGLEQRVREAAPDGVAAALDCIGTDEAVDVSLALVADHDRIVTLASAARAEADGFRHIAGAKPASKAYRDSVRRHVVDLAADGRLEVPVARTFPLADALDAVELLSTGHPGGKLALVP